MSCETDQFAASRFDFGAFAGETYKLTLENLDSDGDAVNLTGYTARMQVRARVQDTDPVATYEIGSGIEVVTATGIVTVKVDTTDWDAGTYVYDLFLTNSDGEREAIVWGTITVREPATKFA